LYKHAVLGKLSAVAGTGRAVEYARMVGVTEHFSMARVAGYIDAAGYAMPIGTTGVTEYAVWGGPAGAVRKYASDGHYEPNVYSGVNA